MPNPFYDVKKSYEENFRNGPFGDFLDGEIYEDQGEPEEDFFGQLVYLPFGISAGPLLNSNFMKAGFSKGFDIGVYKTVRSRLYQAHVGPNILAVETAGDLPLGKDTVRVKEVIGTPDTIVNSFGVPSSDPEFWGEDLPRAIKSTRKGQVVVGSFQGTLKEAGDVESYIQDFVDTAKMVATTGVKVMEVNLSCPNEGSTHLLCFDIKRSKRIIENIKLAVSRTPLIIKIAYFQDHAALAELIKAVGDLVQGIAAINTIPKKVVNEKNQQALPGEGRLVSGISGSGIKWAGLDMVKRLKALRKTLGLNYKIVGGGGVVAPTDYLEYREAGADVVMAATGPIWNPYLAQEIKKLVLYK